MTPKFISSNGKHGFRYITANTIPHTSDDMRCLSQLSHNSISSPYSLRDLQHKKQTQYSTLQIKTIPKNTFQLSASYFYFFINLAIAIFHETTITVLRTTDMSNLLKLILFWWIIANSRKNYT